MNIDPIKILVIEDNPGDIEILRAGFEGARVNNELQFISDGEEALRYFDQAETMPDLVLLDLNLPKVDGIEILRHMRGIERSKAVPVVVLTSSEAEIDVARSYSEHANSYITKPVNFEKFLEVIRKLECFWLSVVKLPPAERAAGLKRAL